MRPADEELVEQARGRVDAPLSPRDRRGSALVGGGLVATAAAMAALLPWHRPLSPLWAVVLVIAYAAVSRVEFEVGPGSAVPTELVLVPMLFLLPAPVVPLAVGAGLLIGGLADRVVGRRHPERVFVLLTYSWHAVGPAAVIALLTDGDARWGDWPIYLLALASQFACDLASSAAREWLAFGVHPRRLLPVMAWVYAIDALLAPVGILAAYTATEGDGHAFGLALSIVALLGLLARERKDRIDRALELSEAYRSASREARTDPLTALGNRLAWEEGIAREEERASTQHPTSIILVDVDGLKVANDTLGHQAGDAVLRALADLIRDAVPGADLIARIGGDEFGVLLPRTESEDCAAIAARLADAICLHPPVAGFELSVALGHATCPPSGSLAEAQLVADGQMYLQKQRARLAQAKQQSRDLLVAILSERDRDLADHSRTVAVLAVAVGKRLGMRAAQLDELARAAELHDVGKVGVPDSVLQKRGPLEPQEWAVIYAHPVIGERLLSAVPALRGVAKVVRASHERYDGRGYPDRLAGDRIPLAARIVFVCDAFATMTSERAYRARPMTEAEAVDEIRQCAGTQFDPTVVECFCDVVAKRAFDPAFSRPVRAVVQAGSRVSA